MQRWPVSKVPLSYYMCQLPVNDTYQHLIMLCRVRCLKRNGMRQVSGSTLLSCMTICCYYRQLTLAKSSRKKPSTDLC